MNIIQAADEHFETVKEITLTTIETVYPKYYPCGAVDFFKKHHSDINISSDIKSNSVYLIADDKTFFGTVTVKENEICRLFVLPIHQHKGYGKCLLDFAENMIFEKYPYITLDASLPAKKIYKLRGYSELEYHQIKTDNGDFLCYDVMQKAK